MSWSQGQLSPPVGDKEKWLALLQHGLNSHGCSQDDVYLCGVVWGEATFLFCAVRVRKWSHLWKAFSSRYTNQSVCACECNYTHFNLLGLNEIKIISNEAKNSSAIIKRQGSWHPTLGPTQPQLLQASWEWTRGWENTICLPLKTKQTPPKKACSNLLFFFAYVCFIFLIFSAMIISNFWDKKILLKLMWLSQEREVICRFTKFMEEVKMTKLSSLLSEMATL